MRWGGDVYPPSMRPPRRLAALLAGLALVAAACADQSDGNPLAASTTATTDRGTTDTTGAGPGGFVPDPIKWSPCQYGECAHPKVPLDYSKPDGELIELSVSRAPATGDRIGALFVNPGGPGASGTDFASVLAMILPTEINERFDIVGFDPRGVGDSTPVDCGVEATELYTVDPTIETPEDRQALLDIST
jgi:pimeloyl-ACP methyl ester carboxylesterase